MIGGGFPNGSVHGDVLNATPDTDEAKVLAISPLMMQFTQLIFDFL